MSEVVHNRLSGREDIVQLAYPPLYRPIAVQSCADLGEHWSIRYAGEDWEMATVVDCARPGDGTAEWMRDNGILLEMGHPRAVELGTVGRGIRVEVQRFEVVEVEPGGRLPGPCLVIGGVE